MNATPLGYNQPLWRGLRFDSNRTNLEASQRRRVIADIGLEQNIVTLDANVRFAYLQLLAAIQGLTVAQQASRNGDRQDQQEHGYAARDVQLTGDIQVRGQAQRQADKQIVSGRMPQLGDADLDRVVGEQRRDRHILEEAVFDH